MAKRFTDSDKWRRSYWFRHLPGAMKFLWMYICDNCDSAGIWTEDLDLARSEMGMDFTLGEYLSAFDGKMIRVEDHRVFFPGFIEFQYGSLSKESKPHLSVARTLLRYHIDPETLTLSIPFVSSFQATKDKEQEQDKDKEQVKEKEKEKEEGGVGGETIPAKVISREEIQTCCSAWRDTLRFFKAGRTLIAFEELQIGQAIQRYGTKAVSLALEGARYEKGTDRFNPAEFLQLGRVLKHENFMRFLNLGVQARNKAGEVAS